MTNEKIVLLNSNCIWYPEHNAVYYLKNTIKLTNKQALLLDALVASKNKIVNVDILYCKIWENSDDLNSRSLRNLVSDLRKKIPSLGIVNYYAEGYLLKINDDMLSLKETISIFDQFNNAICITDPNQDDNPVIYVNQAFTDIFLYTFNEVIGKNCRFLQNNDRDQEGIALIRNAVKNEKPITTILKNYKKNGQLIYSEISINPIADINTKKIKFFIGVQKNISENKQLLKQIQEILE